MTDIGIDGREQLAIIVHRFWGKLHLCVVLQPLLRKFFKFDALSIAFPRLDGFLKQHRLTLYFFFVFCLCHPRFRTVSHRLGNSLAVHGISRIAPYEIRFSALGNGRHAFFPSSGPVLNNVTPEEKSVNQKIIITPFPS